MPKYQAVKSDHNGRVSPKISPADFPILRVAEKLQSMSSEGIIRHATYQYVTK